MRDKKRDKKRETLTNNRTPDQKMEQTTPNETQATNITNCNLKHVY